MEIHHSPSPFKRRKTNASADENPGEFPEWMLDEVLVRVPFQSLRALKLVSKQWNRTISDPSFARAYVDRLSRKRRWFLISGFARKQSINDRLFHNNSDRCGIDLGLLILGRSQEDKSPLTHVVVGTSNGLLLYGPRSWHGCYSSYEISNPVTGKRITVPPSRSRYEFVATGFVTRIEHGILASFRVVRVNVHHQDSGFVTFDVYSSETRAWEYHKIHERIYFFKWRNPVVIGTTLHWMITGHRVAAYDPYDNPGSIRLFRLPSHDGAIDAQTRTERDLRDVLFDQHEGHLRFAEAKLVARGNRQWTDISVWVECGSGTWGLRRRALVDCLSTCSIPLCFNPFDPDVFYVINAVGLFSYDFGTGTVRIEDGSKRASARLLPYGLSYFSLVTPPCPSLVDPRVLSSGF